MTSSIKLKIICEGQTEETFASNLLYPELSPRGVYCVPYCLITSVKSRTYRGGKIKYKGARKDILRSLKETGAYVTTMFDLYQLSEDFPGKEEASHQKDPYDKVRIIEESLAEDINNPYFIPYIQLHEFEALLYSDVNCIDRVMKYSDGTKLQELDQIKMRYKNPEEINEGEETAPSKRLIRLYPSYQKTTNGVSIAKLVTINKMRQECCHFDDWIKILVDLGF